MSNGKKTAVEKAESRATGVGYLLTQMLDLASKEIEEITPEIWDDSRKAFKKSNREHIKTWEALNRWNKYKDLRACLVYARDSYECKYCLASYPEDGVTLTVDHIIPSSQGGGEDLDNLVCCCAPCNRAKLNNPEQFQEWLKRRVR